MAAAMAVAHACDMPLSEIAAAVRELPPTLLRHKITRMNTYTVINDAYNSSPESVRAALAILVEQDGTPHSALLGDMLELGELSEQMHTELGTAVAGAGIDKLYLVGNFAEATAKGAILGGMEREKIFILNRADKSEDIAKTIIELMIEGEVILIKGSHASGLYRVAERLEESND